MKDDTLSTILGTEIFEPSTDIVVNVKPESSVSQLVVETNENPEDADFDYARKNQIDLIETSKTAVQVALKITNESEQARAVETLALMLKTASEMNRQLVIMSKDRAEVKIARSGNKSSVHQALADGKNGKVVSNLRAIKKMLADLDDEDNDG